MLKYELVKVTDPSVPPDESNIGLGHGKEAQIKQFLSFGGFVTNSEEILMLVDSGGYP